jgi:hypothetical protein
MNLYIKIFSFFCEILAPYWNSDTYLGVEVGKVCVDVSTAGNYKASRKRVRNRRKSNNVCLTSITQ